MSVTQGRKAKWRQKSIPSRLVRRVQNLSRVEATDTGNCRKQDLNTFHMLYIKERTFLCFLLRILKPGLGVQWKSVGCLAERKWIAAFDRNESWQDIEGWVSGRVSRILEPCIFSGAFSNYTGKYRISWRKHFTSIWGKINVTKWH